MSSILVLHGPNLNLLGTREPHIYGNTTLADINQALETKCNTKNFGFSHLQSNAEHTLIEAIHTAKSNGVDFIIFNPGAFTHTSIALRDAFIGVDIPFIECHISNIFSREEFRHHSYLSDIAKGVICGLGAFSYTAALSAAFNFLDALDA